MNQAQPIFRARAPGGGPDEGLELALVGGGQVAVAIKLDGRRQVVTLARHDALDLAALLRSRLARRTGLRVVEPTGRPAA